MADNIHAPTAKIANPGPLGLFAFGMTTVLLALHNLGFFAIDSVILSMGLFYGGIAQIAAGLVEYRRGHVFTATAFTSYGSFWLTFVLIKNGAKGVADPAAMGSYFIIWGVFTLIFFIGTLRKGRAVRFVFLTLMLLFFVVGANAFMVNAWMGYIAGVIGIVCGAAAVYTAAGELLNEEFGREVLNLN